MITKPMLAGTVKNPELIKFPVLATPKLDGIRCLKLNGKALSRSFKAIPNKFTSDWIEANCVDGLDGELMANGATFSEICGHIGREEGEADFCYYVFDYVSGDVSKPYSERVAELAALPDLPRVKKILPVLISSMDELSAFEEKCLSEGFEGVMIRTPDSPYKCGRSTEREGWLVKIKRFEDAEAIVIGCVEGLHNANEAFKDELGHTKRSTAKDGMVGRGTLGALIVKDPETGLEFKISGLDMATNQAIWNKRDQAIGRLVKYRHQPVGAKNAPRFPTFLGFREEWDLSA